MYDEKTTQRFLAKVSASNDQGCKLWTGARIKRYGYGQFGVKVDGKWGMRRAHRVAWEIAHGPIPDGLCVLHDCDVTNCVNPAHLFLGTQTQNMADMRAKGRGSTPPLHIGPNHHLWLGDSASAKVKRQRCSQGPRI